jgi:tetratricopeptide (TPR) repeat protein
MWDVFRATGRLKEAEASCRQALALQKQLAADFPSRPDYRKELAISYYSLSDLLRATARPKEAETACRDALALQKQLVADFPTRPDYRRELALSYNSLGNLLDDSGRPMEGEPAYREALPIQKQLAAEFPTLSDYQNDLAVTLTNLGELANNQKKYSDAIRWLEEAQSHNQKALRSNPRHHYYRQMFRDNRQQLAKARVGLGEHAAAGTAVEDMLKIGYDQAQDNYEAAGIFARCIPLAEKDGKLREARRQELAKSYGDGAIAALRRAVKNGYKDVANIKNDKDLDPLRSRADFKELLQELEKSAPGKGNRPVSK